MLSFTDVKTYVEAQFQALGYAETDMPLIDPGPFSDPRVLKRTPGRVLVLTVGGGGGFEVEQLYDETFITARVVGTQNNYDDAQRLMADVDKMLVRLNSPAWLGSTRVLYVTRAGGPPQLIDRDSAERYHFQATYVSPAATGL
jgi:hypothetical protein